MLAVLPGKGPTFNTDYLPTFLEIIVSFRWCSAISSPAISCDLQFMRECRRKHDMALVPDEKAKSAKKKNLQVMPCNLGF
jgi:hypothetical protein